MNSAEEMDAKDEELRETIKTLWPIQGNAMAFILIPPKEGLETALLLLLLVMKQLGLNCCDCYLLLKPK